MTEENVVVEETVEETTEDFEIPTESEEVESTEEATQEEETPYDWNTLELKHLDDVKHLSDYTPEEAASLFRKGIDYDRQKSKYEEKMNSAHYKWVDEYMKAKGYSDGTEFVKAIKVNEKMSQLMQKGMSEQDALAEATEYVNSTFGNQTDKRTKELESFLGWHQSKVDAGKFSGKLDIDSIPQQVIDAYERGESLREAYMDYMLDDITVKTEQETLKKLAKNKETSTGGLKPGATPEATMTPEQIEAKLNSLSTKERQKWIEKNFEKIEKSGYFR